MGKVGLLGSDLRRNFVTEFAILIWNKNQHKPSVYEFRNEVGYQISRPREEMIHIQELFVFFEIRFLEDCWE